MLCDCLVQWTKALLDKEASFFVHTAGLLPFCGPCPQGSVPASHADLIHRSWEAASHLTAVVQPIPRQAFLTSHKVVIGLWAALAIERRR